jgi:hypothetical protein
MLRSLLVAIILLATISFESEALEVREGRVKLVLHENTGRFSLYYLVDMKKERYESLFVDQDPRTSFVSLLLDDRPLRLGDTASLRCRAEKIEGGARFIFESAAVSVTQTFTFIRTAGATLADGIQVDIAAVNKGERESSVGFRFLLDTKLGEKKREHFSTDRRSITGEISLRPVADGDRWWFSRSDSIGLMGSLAIPKIQPPDSVHIANWKRLSDAPWKFTPSVGRNFNLLPYSIDDSAICYYFEPAPLARGAERRISVLLAAANDAGFSTVSTEVDAGLSRLLSASVEEAESPELALRTDLVTVRDLIERVDAAVAAGGTVSDEELAALETVIERLKERNGLK